jgi:SlyX protein
MEQEEIRQRFDTIETKLAHLEDFLGRLQEQVLERNGVSDRLVSEQAAVKEKLLQVAAELEEIPNRKPPHY